MLVENSKQYRRVPSVVYFDEAVAPSESLAAELDLEGLKALGWVPLRREGGWAWVATCREDRDTVLREAARALKVEEVSLSPASPATVRRFIEHAQDVNPEFPATAGRTALARTRTFLAGIRSEQSCYRSVLAKGRTGLSMLRTGLALATVSMVILKVFGMAGLVVVPEAILGLIGAVLVVDGLIWYIPARRLARSKPLRAPAPPGPEITVPVARLEKGHIVVTRTPPVPGAAEWVKDCERHSPIMRRRFLALERTELAMERTRQAHFRTVMSKSRTGMALVRTGISLAGLGIAFLRSIHVHPTDAFGIALVAVGTVLTLEGLSWYVSGRGAGRTSLDEAERAEGKSGAWSMLLPPVQEEHEDRRYRCVPLVLPGCSPGIWGTTGLALERTLLAERRNVMSRFRTSLACSRTGMAYVRTGANFVAVGLGLLVTGTGPGLGWIVLESAIMAVGVLLLADGLYWHLPARRNRWQIPFCEWELEITVPDYSLPPGQWKSFVLGGDHG